MIGGPSVPHMKVSKTRFASTSQAHLYEPGCENALKA